MLFVAVAVCAIITTFTVSRYHLAKTRLVEAEIEKVIARQFPTSERALELGKLREENSVMRNLLLDLVENETLIPMSQSDRSTSELSQLRAAKVQRYREILSESVHFLNAHRPTEFVLKPATSHIDVDRKT